MLDNCHYLKCQKKHCHNCVNYEPENEDYGYCIAGDCKSIDDMLVYRNDTCGLFRYTLKGKQ